MPEVEDDEAAGACGCGEVVPQVGEEGGEEWLMELNLSGPCMGICGYGLVY